MNDTRWTRDYARRAGEFFLSVEGTEARDQPPWEKIDMTNLLYYVFYSLLHVEDNLCCEEADDHLILTTMYYKIIEINVK